MSKTVSYTNVHLSYTADLQGLRQAKSDMAAMNRVTKQAQTDTQKYEEHVVKLNRLLHNGKISQEQYNQALNAARTRFQNAEKAAAGYANTLRSVAGVAGMQQLGSAGSAFGLMAGGGPLAIGALATAGTYFAGSEATKAYMDLRSELVRLEVLLGSVKEAENAFNEMRRLAAASPLETKDFTQAAAVLAQYGVESQKLIPTLSRLSDISAGNGEVFGRLALAYGQVVAANRLTGQELRQLINAGFNPLSEISRTTGESMESLKDRMEAGSLSVKEFENAVISATEAGGRFYGLTVRMGEELSGKFAQLRDEFTKLKEAGGEIIAPELYKTITMLKDVLEFTNMAQKVLDVGEIARAINLPGGDRELAFRLHGKEMGTKGGFLDPLTQREMDAAKREHETLVKQLEKQSSLDSIKFFTVTAKSISEGVAGQMDGAMKSAAGIHEQLSKAGKVIAEHSHEITQHNVKQRAAELERIAKLKQQADDVLNTAKPDSAINTELPKAISMATKEGYEYVRNAQQSAQQKQLEEQRRQRQAQEEANKILEQIKNKPAMGIVK